MVMGEALVYVWLAFLFTMLFVFGIIIGSFLNVVIVRLPAGQNLMHPPSHCGVCGHLISFWERLPLISYWWLRGRCRGCGAPFSMRYFWVELFTGIGVVALYFLEIGWQPTSYYRYGGFWYLTWGVFPPNSWIIFLYHALLFFFLVVAAGMGAEHGWMPRRLTAIAICVGLAGSALMPWPWPAESRSALLVEGWENNRWAGDPPWRRGHCRWTELGRMRRGGPTVACSCGLSGVRHRRMGSCSVWPRAWWARPSDCYWLAPRSSRLQMNRADDRWGPAKGTSLPA